MPDRPSRPGKHLLACLLVSLAVPANGAEQVTIDWAALRDVDGGKGAETDADWTVVAFLGVECPLARLYGPRLAKLRSEYAARGVRFLGVNSNPQDSVEEIRESRDDLRLDLTIVKDEQQALARQFAATRTPEVFVVDAGGRIRYRGRIDDQYEPGLARSAPRRHDLREALEALLEGREPPTASTTPVGCLITYQRTAEELADDATPVTFTRDVAPVLNRHCVECHRPGEIGPFSLTDYDEVVGWGEMMLEVIEQGRMPPWHADPRYGEFVGAREMPAEDKQTLSNWVAQGMPHGDLDDLPQLAKPVAGWHLATAPDEEWAMRSRAFVVPADGVVEYQYFVVDPKWEEDRWVRAAQVVPGDAAVVHHAIVFVRPPDGAEARGIGWLGAYVPGQRTVLLPTGHARRVPAGSKLVFQMHYTPNGRETRDTTRVGIWLSDADEVTHEVTTRVALNHDFEIPPGANDHTVTLRLDRFYAQSQLLSVTPHMHLRGKSFRLTIPDDRQPRMLLSVPHYDFNWQHSYQFRSPISLAETASLGMEISFDNSADNPANPNPAEYVTWGDQTWEEMAVAFFDVAHPRDTPRVPVRPVASASEVDEASRSAAIREQVDAFLATMDADGDGIVLKDEVPLAFRRFGFRRMDHNRDDRLDREEIEIEAARRQ